MTPEIFTIATDYIILEVYKPEEHLYEYYLQYGTNDFEYKFGAHERFSRMQLTALADAGYFEI